MKELQVAVAGGAVMTGARGAAASVSCTCPVGGWGWRWASRVCLEEEIGVANRAVKAPAPGPALPFFVCFSSGAARPAARGVCPECVCARVWKAPPWRTRAEVLSPLEICLPFLW